MSRPDHINRRLQYAVDLLTLVADELQITLADHLRQGVPVARAGGVIRLAVQIEQLNQLAAQTWEIRQARVTDAPVRQRFPAHG